MSANETLACEVLDDSPLAAGAAKVWVIAMESRVFGSRGESADVLSQFPDRIDQGHQLAF